MVVEKRSDSCQISRHPTRKCMSKARSAEWLQSVRLRIFKNLLKQWQASKFDASELRVQTKGEQENRETFSSAASCLGPPRAVTAARRWACGAQPVSRRSLRVYTSCPPKPPASESVVH